MNIRYLTVIVAALAVLPASSGQDIAVEAGGSSTTELEAAEMEARAGLALAESRLELVLARQALQGREMKTAAGRAIKVLELLKGAPADADVDGYALQAEGILARAERAGVDLESLGQQNGEFEKGTLNDDKRQAQRAWDRFGQMVKQAEETGRIEAPDVVYPEDWRIRTAKRAKYAGGEVARSGSSFDEDGREWYTALYDVRDLTYVAPDFQPPFSLYSSEGLRDSLDRHAFWRHYGMFGGYGYCDLNSAAPMLRAFGGFDDYAWRGPKYSPWRQAQVVQMIERFTDETPPKEPTIISLEP